MKTRAVVAGGLLALAGVWAISAVGQAMMSGPAEVPPLSYQGREYVDSTGCMFIRAGVDGNVVWVPRVNSSREPVCGFQPTFTAAQLASVNSGSPMMPTIGDAGAIAISDTMAAPATPYSPGPQVVNDIFVPGSSTTNMASAGSTSAMATDGSSRVVNDIFVPSGSAAPVTYVAEGSTYTSGGGSTAAPRGSGGSGVVNDIYVGGSSGGMVAGDIYTGGTSGGGSVVGDIYVGGSGGAPLSIGIPNRNAAPAGYRQAWDDGRLNPNRGPRSSVGDQSMYAVWTDDTPMQLVSDAALQRRGLGALNPFRSTKTVEPQPVSASGGYIQIGTFGQAANVSKSIARLNAMGIAATTRQSGSAQAVLAGPFPNAQVAAEALAFLRARGYSDAFIR